MNRKPLHAVALSAFLLAFAGAAPAGLAGWAQPSVSEAIERERAMVSARDLSAAFRHASETIEPAVVHIITEQNNRRGFRAQTGVGSGVIMDPRGYILTNAHVVAQGTSFTVRLADGREVTGTLIGAFAETDLAVLRIDAPGLRVASFGDSEGLGVGEWVLAVGSPFGFEQTVTAGIVSAKGRGTIDPQSMEEGPTRFQEFIQTDAAINPGNSGGPLVDLEGRVIGINTAIASRDGGSSGLGFAIPSDVARVVMERIIENGRVDRGWLGVSMGRLDPQVAFELGIQGGVLVESVLDDSPAALAGLETGDIIVSLGGRRTENVTRLGNAIMLSEPGQPADIAYYRAGVRRTTSAVMQDRGTAQAVAAGGERLDRAGLIIVPFELPVRRGTRTGEIGGYLVSEVLPGTPASASGFRASDFIVEVDGRSFDTARELGAFIEGRTLEEPLRFSIIRGNQRGSIYLKRD
jgi:serine protease Do|tara:strand:+ start:5064 stop:6455 length:1392 start_codon:yes stop_codon:yes gene_type:complete